MEIISPIVFTTSIIFTRPTGTPFQMILCTAWIIHYINRSIIHPIRATSMAPIHILPFICSIFFNVLNGYTNGVWIGRHSNATDTQFWTGIIIWVSGFVSNIYHDNILFQLRRINNEKKETSKKYFIPHGGLFEYISCPNYFSETIEWLGFTIATHGSIPAIIFTIATAANLFPRAWRTHQWYKNQFKDTYPKNRKAVLPFLL
jgi:3-oxo-5-alpha-steroid 4-dehydrogenase 1